MSGSNTGPVRGSAVIMALFVLLIITVMGSAVLRMAAVEKKVTESQKYTEMLRQAADAGIQTGRNIIMNYTAARHELPELEHLYLNNGIRVEISFEAGLLDGREMVSVTSRAFLADVSPQISKAVRALILIDALPAYVIRADTLKIAGRYEAAVTTRPVEEGRQDWEVYGAEPRLEGDPACPSDYPLKGVDYLQFVDTFRENHPYFRLDQQQWPECHEPESTWEISYEYGCVGESCFHQLEQSKIRVNPFYYPRGYLQVVDGEGREEIMAVASGWCNSMAEDETSWLFEDNLPYPLWGECPSENYCQSLVLKDLMESRSSIIYPDKTLQSRDFVKAASLLTSLAAPHLPLDLLTNCRRLAQLDPEWDYLAPDSGRLRLEGNVYQVDINRLNSTCIFIDRPAGETVELNFNAWLDPGESRLSDWLEGPREHFYHLIHEGWGVIIISPANLRIIADSAMFDHLNSRVAFYVLSGGDMDLALEPVFADCRDEPRSIRAFLQAAGDIHMLSRASGCHYQGCIYAGQQLYIQMAWERELEGEPYFTVQKDAGIMQLFPQSWVFLGLAPIVACTYLD